MGRGTYVIRRCTRHVHVALALIVAVPAGAVDFAVVFGVEVDDLEAEMFRYQKDCP